MRGEKLHHVNRIGAERKLLLGKRSRRRIDAEKEKGGNRRFQAFKNKKGYLYSTKGGIMRKKRAFRERR